MVNTFASTFLSQFVSQIKYKPWLQKLSFHFNMLKPFISIHSSSSPSMILLSGLPFSQSVNVTWLWLPQKYVPFVSNRFPDVQKPIWPWPKLTKKLFIYHFLFFFLIQAINQFYSNQEFFCTNTLKLLTGFFYRSNDIIVFFLR